MIEFHNLKLFVPLPLLHVLDIALTKSVKKFIYVSIFNAHMYEYLEIVRAHEDFVRDLQKRIDSCHQQEGCTEYNTIKSNQNSGSELVAQFSCDYSQKPHLYAG